MGAWLPVPRVGGPAAGPRVVGYLPCCRGPASVRVSVRWSWAPPGLAKPSADPTDSDPPIPVQGYKMDDLLTSYVEQLLSTVNRPQGARAPTKF